MQKNPTPMLELYSDYLISNISYSTATGLARILPQELTHDKVTQFLNRNEFDSKHLWKKVKASVREFENSEGVLIFDDCIAEKEFTDENEIMCWHRDHAKGRHVKGVNLLTSFVSYDIGEDDERISLPISYEVVEKTISYCDIETQREQRKSVTTKNERFQNLLVQAVHEQQVKFKYVLADSWFSSQDNLNCIKQDLKKDFIFGIKSNRLVSLSPNCEKRKDLKKIDELNLKDEEPVQVYLKGCKFPVLLMKKTFKNENGSTGTLYLACSDLSLNGNSLLKIYKKRWKIEEYHRSIKNNTSLTKSPTKKERSQLNHLFCSLYGFVKLEVMSLEQKVCQTTIRMKLILRAQQAALEELQHMRMEKQIG